MRFTLDITFGGLCMFVNSREHQRLFVLMPMLRHSEDEDDHNHFPTLVYDTKYEQRLYGATPLDTTRSTLVRDDKTMIRLLPNWDTIQIGNPAKPGNNVTMPSELGAVSLYAGGRAVDRSFLETKPTGCLAVRIELPFGVRIDPDRRHLGRIAVTFANPTKKTHKLQLTGQATVSIELDETELSIAGKKLKPDGRKMEIDLVNLPQPDIEKPKQHRHEMCEKMHHFRAYYSLLSGDCTPPAGVPDLIVDEYVEEQELRTRGVDPWRCTVSFGDPP
jgi:hypothetical protein